MIRAHANHIVITWKAPAAAREGGRSPTPSGVRGLRGAEGSTAADDLSSTENLVETAAVALLM